MADYTRQLDILPPDRAARVHIDIVGVGGEGSPTVPMLAKMGFLDVRVFDWDVVEEVNLSSQWYRLEDARLRRPKVHACQAVCREFSEAEVVAVFDDAIRHDLRGIVIVAVDSMATRAELWERACHAGVRRWIG